MKLLRICVLSLFVFASSTFAQRGGSHGGGGSRGGGGGFRGGGSSGGGYRGGGGFTSGGGYRGGGGFRSGIGAGFSRGGGYGRGYGGYGYGYGRGYGYRGYSSFAFGFGYPYYFGYGGYYDYPYSYYGYGYDPYSYYYPQVAYAAAPPVYYDQGPTVASPPRQAPNRDYPANSQQYKDTIYLIAFSDHRILACLSYWVEGDTLHYVTRQHEHREAPLNEIDRAFSEQLNRDRRVEFRLPR
jgi:hypothetical protein